jgi:hypothetical protein
VKAAADSSLRTAAWQNVLVGLASTFFLFMFHRVSKRRKVILFFSAHAYSLFLLIGWFHKKREEEGVFNLAFLWV